MREETRTEPIPRTPQAPRESPVSGPPVSPAGPTMRGRATVPPQRAAHTAPHAEYETLTDLPHREKVAWFGPDSRLGGSRRGLELSIAAGLFTFVAWGIWAFDNKAGSFVTHLVFFLFVVLVAVGVFCAARIAGYYLYSRVLRRRRGSARLSHLLTAAFLVLAGIGYLKDVTAIAEGLDWIQGLM
ncbi:hypothetical protein AB0I28_10535 [Phytomonospora sp. NPDC050363]|uniref:hypothetical protein n=1 Tax=Phytomonospora sp. NPDC050363 TaxID=3155642 RepID=UPI0033EE9C37